MLRRASNRLEREPAKPDLLPLLEFTLLSRIEEILAEVVIEISAVTLEAVLLNNGQHAVGLDRNSIVVERVYVEEVVVEPVGRPIFLQG